MHPKFLPYGRVVAEELPQFLVVFEVVAVVDERWVPAKVLRHPWMTIEEASKRGRLAVALPAAVSTVPVVALEDTHPVYERPCVFAELFPRQGMVLQPEAELVIVLQELSVVGARGLLPEFVRDPGMIGQELLERPELVAVGVSRPLRKGAGKGSNRSSAHRKRGNQQARKTEWGNNGLSHRFTLLHSSFR